MTPSTNSEISDERLVTASADIDRQMMEASEKYVQDRFPQMVLQPVGAAAIGYYDAAQMRAAYRSGYDYAVSLSRRSANSAGGWVGVKWPGRKFCEIAERNISELAKFIKGEDDKLACTDAALAIRTLLSSLAVGAEPVAWRVESKASPGEAWEWIEGREPSEYLGCDDFTITALYTAPVAARPTYEQIIDLVEECRVRRDKAGESSRMMSKWISEGLNALYASSLHPTEGAAPVAWLCNGMGNGWIERDQITFDRATAEHRAAQEAWTVIPLYTRSSPVSAEVTDVLERAAAEAYRVCAETRHVTLGDKARDAILALAALNGGLENG